MTDVTLAGFSRDLASKAPAPGGGAAGAVVGALAAALGQMVCQLSLGKAAYAAYEDQNCRIATVLEEHRVALLDLVEADAEAFLPVSRAYAIPKDDPTRASVMDEALKVAAQPPLQMMARVAAIVEELQNLPGKSSKLAFSDVGVAAAFAAAALEGSLLNVQVNTAMMSDGESASAIDAQAALFSQAIPVARQLYEMVRVATMRRN